MKSKQELKKILLDALKPVPKLSVSCWADKFRQLPSTSAEPGLWHTDRVPYMREVMDAFTQAGVHRVAVKSSSQVGKALDILTPVPTVAGFKLMRDLQVGDEVFDEAGQVCCVTAVSEIFYNHKCFELTFSDGAKIVADAEHNWLVQDNVQEKILTTAEIARTFKAGKRNRYALPVALPLQLPEQNLPIDPYTLGVFLGDGHAYSGQITMHKNDVEIARRIESLGHKIVIREKGNILNVQIDPKVIGKIGNKHIPEIYLRGSYEQRLELLRGLMDADGTISTKGGCSFDQKNTRMAFQVAELLRSLGFKPTIKARKVSCVYKGEKKISESWRLFFLAYADVPVFHLARKKARLKSREGNRISETFRRRITSVVEVESRPTKCISVSSPSHLYLAGESFIPTHNSEVLLNVLGRFVQLDPCNILLVQPTLEMAQDFSKDRLAKMISDSKSLTPLFFGDKESSKSRDKNQTMLSKFFKGGRLVLAGANSAAGLASRPVRLLLCDEVDRFPDSASGNEGDPVDLAQKRMTTYWNYCMGLFSTPTTLGASRIDIEYDAGTQEQWQHKCPNCGAYHFLRWQDMKCDYDVRERQGTRTIIMKSVMWQCPDCGFEFTERQMKSSEQKYIAQNPEALANGSRSFWINGFTSPWLSWLDIMREWYEARGNPQREKVVMNTRFGESYEEVSKLGDENQFLKRLEDYDAEIPAGVDVLTCGVDVQDNRLEYEIVGWNRRTQEAFGIQKAEIFGKPNKAKTWAELDEVLDKIYYKADGTGLKVARTFIDSGGHFTSDVYAYCRKNIYKGRFAIKGQGGAGVPLIYKTAKIESLPVILLGVNEGKQEVMTRLSIESGEQYFHYPVEDDYCRGYDEKYFKGLISEHAVVKFTGGRVYRQWEPIKKSVRNEPLDLRVYALSAFFSLKSNADKMQTKKSPARRLELI